MKELTTTFLINNLGTTFQSNFLKGLFYLSFKLLDYQDIFKINMLS